MCAPLLFDLWPCISKKRLPSSETQCFRVTPRLHLGGLTGICFFSPDCPSPPGLAPVCLRALTTHCALASLASVPSLATRCPTRGPLPLAISLPGGGLGLAPCAVHLLRGAFLKHPVGSSLFPPSPFGKAPSSILSVTRKLLGGISPRKIRSFLSMKSRVGTISHPGKGAERKPTLCLPFRVQWGN